MQRQGKNLLMSLHHAIFALVFFRCKLVLTGTHGRDEEDNIFGRASRPKTTINKQREL
jgi:hypothetical protein